MKRHILGFVLLIALGGCSMPRIIILNDPLDAKQHNDLGVSYEQRQEYDLALREYRRAVELDSDWALPWFNLGNVHARQKQWAQAQKAYRRSLKIDPQGVQVSNNLAWVLVEDGEISEGIALAEQVVATEGENPSYWDTLAGAYLAAGRLDAAKQAASQGLARQPSPGLQEMLQDKLRNIEEQAAADLEQMEENSKKPILER